MANVAFFVMVLVSIISAFCDGVSAVDVPPVNVGTDALGGTKSP
uniref:Uncharacterized protein n=1 Tax=Anopheles dirus TaxID=7168 RepID=A0A182NXM1_9DIPT